MRRIYLSSLLVTLVACGSSSTEATTTNDDSSTTSGSEDTRAPTVLRTSTPVPVPSPDVPREELSAKLQSLWSGVEEVVAIRPPEPPDEGTMDALNAWARGPFQSWVQQRNEANRSVEGIAQELRDDEATPGWENIVGAALFGYMYEDMAAGARGAPVPNEIANDPELLGIYSQALTDSIRPIAQRSFQAYMYCATTFAEAHQTEANQAAPEGAADPAAAEPATEPATPTGEAEAEAPLPWATWAVYCFERAREVNDVFELAPPLTQEGDDSAPATPEPVSTEEASEEDQ